MMKMRTLGGILAFVGVGMILCVIIPYSALTACIAVAGVDVFTLGLYLEYRGRGR